MTTEPKCEFCDKRGLPILLVRYAIAPNEANAPKLTAPLAAKDAGGKDIALGGKTHYTTRMLRSGYLYVHDEARKRWEGYFVTAGGYYKRFDITQPLPIAYAKGGEPCDYPGHREIASCITITSPKQATNVWFGFSDVEWTDAVLKQHASADYRARHMRKLDVKAWLGSQRAQHAAPVKKLDGAVAEYTAATRARGFAFSPAEYQTRQRQAKTLVDAAERLNPGKGLILALNDPAGITQDLAALMQTHADTFLANPTRQRGLAISGVIAQMEAAIKDQAERCEIQAIDEDADRVEYGGVDIASFDPLGKPVIEAPDLPRARKIRAMNNPTHLNKVMDAEWRKYTAKYNASERARWQADFDTALGTFDTEFIVPLAQAHVAWMTSRRLAEYFECNFDPHHAASGAVYTRQVQLCVAGTQDKKICFDLYTDWLKGDDLTDRKNLLLRALLLNLDAQAKAISDAVKTAVDWRGLPWDGLIGNFAKATERVMANMPDVLGKLLIQMGGPLAQLMREATEGPVRQALVAVGAVSGQPVVRVEVAGGRKAFRAMLIRELLKSSGQIATGRQMERAVALELKRLAIRGDTLEGSDKKRWLLMIDPDQARAMPKDLSAQQRAQWLAHSLHTPEQIEELNLARWRVKVNQGGVIIKGASPFVFGVAAGLFQFAALSKLNEDVNKSMAHEKTENQWRRGAGVAALAGTTAEFMGMAIGRVPTVTLTAGQGLLSVSKQVASVVGKTAGLGAALVMAWWDFMKGQAEISEGNVGIAWTYRASGVIGIGAAAALLIGWTGIGFILVGLLFAVTILIESFKDNKLQDWLERCLWGTLAGQRYGDMAVEMREFKLAIEG